MLESTFFASHSSFMAMVGLVDQFTVLRDFIGNTLAMFAIYRYIRNFFYKILGFLSLNILSPPPPF